MPANAEHEEILRAIERMDRAPMREQLARLLSVKATVKSLQAFANRYPDRHMQAVAIAMKGSGYSEAPALSLHITAKLDGLSDSQVLAELQRRLSALGLGPHALPQGVVVGADTGDHDAERDATDAIDSST